MARSQAEAAQPTKLSGDSSDTAVGFLMGATGVHPWRRPGSRASDGAGQSEPSLATRLPAGRQVTDSPAMCPGGTGETSPASQRRDPCPNASQSRRVG